ncbi:MAG: 2,3-bisphosphoglycerate-independent phosphoglycerate mutase [Bacilli bacterium]
MKQPIILCIMDGYGVRQSDYGNAIHAAHKPNLDRIFAEYPYTEIETSGEAVGLPDGQMGNSEVGHLNIGAGRIVYQSLTLINKAVRDGSFFHNEKYLKAIDHAKKHNSSLHIFGLVSDGGVHSHLLHILAMLQMAKKNNIEKVFVHAFMDGRDVDPRFGASYVQQIQDEMDRLGIGAIADISGRYWAMDRDKNLDRVDVAYRVMVDHDGPSFTDFKQYFKQQYEYLPTIGMDASDEFLIPHYNAKVDGRIKDDDAIIFMNFRPDRAIEISTVLTNPYFYQNPPINANGVPAYKAYVPQHILKNLFYVCTMKYAESVKGEIAFHLPTLNNILGPYLASNGYHQLRIAETEKYAHVTFFFDGTVNYDGVEKPALTNCKRVLINSPKVSTYDAKPEMSAFEVKDALIKELDKGYLDVVILNFANCDMVGHTAIFKAVVKAVETVDLCVGEIYDWTKKNGGIMLITADHGNAEEVYDDLGHPITSHTKNVVPFCITKPGLKLVPKGGKLANIAPTILDLLELQKPLEMDEASLIIK